jgi:hypothetical protein
MKDLATLTERSSNSSEQSQRAKQKVSLINLIGVNHAKNNR